MSHFTKVQTKIKDKEVLLRCLAEMKYQVQEGGVIRGYTTEQRKVDILANMKKGYNIGFVRNKSGNYEIVADWWGVKGTSKAKFTSQLEQQLEEVEAQIRREYAVQTVLDQTQQQGFNLVEQTKEQDGSIRIVVRRWGQ